MRTRESELSESFSWDQTVVCSALRKTRARAFGRTNLRMDGMEHSSVRVRAALKESTESALGLYSLSSKPNSGEEEREENRAQATQQSVEFDPGQSNHLTNYGDRIIRTNFEAY